MALPAEVEQVTMGDGNKLFIDTTFEPEKYESVYGTVLAMPEGDTRINVGAKVYFHYLAVSHARDQHESCYFKDDDGNRYAVLNYKSMFFDIYEEPLYTPDWNNLVAVQAGVTAPEVITMHNDWCLIDPQPAEREMMNIAGMDVAIDKSYKGSALLLLAPEPNKSNDGWVTHCPAGCGLKPGDQVTWTRESDVPVEYSLIRTMPKNYYRMKLSDITCKVVDDEMIPIGDKVIVKPVEQDETYGTKVTIYRPQNTRRALLLGEVFRVGDDVISALTPGTLIMYASGAGTDMPIGNDICTQIIQEDIALILKPSGV